MTENEIIAFASALPGVVAFTPGPRDDVPEMAWGDTFFFYDPDDDVGNRRFPFATIVIKDYVGFESASQLDRSGAFRLNTWVSKETFAELFPDEVDHDFTAFDVAMPHPTYGDQGWVSVVNPGPATDDLVRRLLTEAHTRAIGRYDRRND